MKHERGGLGAPSRTIAKEASVSQESQRVEQPGVALRSTAPGEQFHRTFRDAFQVKDAELDWHFLEARAQEIEEHERALGPLRPLFEHEVEVDAIEAKQHEADETKDKLRACKSAEAAALAALRDTSTRTRHAEQAEERAHQYYVGDRTPDDPDYPDALLKVDPFTESRIAWQAYEATQRDAWMQAKAARETAENTFREARTAYRDALEPALDRWHAAKEKIRSTWKELAHEAEERLTRLDEDVRERSLSETRFQVLRKEQREQLQEDVTALFDAERLLHQTEALPVDADLPEPSVEDLEDLTHLFQEALKTKEGPALTDVLETYLKALNEAYPLDALKTWAHADRTKKDPRIREYVAKKERLDEIIKEKYKERDLVEERLFAKKLHYRDVRKHPDYLAAEKAIEEAMRVAREELPPPPPVAAEIENINRRSRHLLRVAEEAVERLRVQPLDRVLKTASAIREQLLLPEEREKYADTYVEDVLDVQWQKEGLDEAVRTQKKLLYKKAMVHPEEVSYDERQRMLGLPPAYALERTVDALAFEAAFEDLYTMMHAVDLTTLPSGAKRDLERELPRDWHYAASYKTHGDNERFQQCRMAAEWDGEPANVITGLAEELTHSQQPRRILLRKGDPASVLVLERHHNLATIMTPELADLFHRDAELGFAHGPTARAFFEGYGSELRRDPSFAGAVETVAQEMEQVQGEAPREALKEVGKKKLTREDLLALQQLLKSKDEDLIGLYCYAISSRNGDDGPLGNPEEDLAQLQHLRTLGLTCEKHYSPFLGSYHSGSYSIRELLRQPLEVQERWAQVLPRAKEARLADDLSRSTYKISDRALYIEDLAARVAWVETALEVQKEGGKDALVAYACLNTATFAEAKAVALELAKEGCLLPKKMETLGTINWIRLLGSAKTPEERVQVVQAFERLEPLQPANEHGFGLALAALDAKTLLAIDEAVQQAPASDALMAGLCALAGRMDIKYFPHNEQYREQQVTDRLLEGSQRERILLLRELLEQKQFAVFQVFCRLGELAPREAETIARELASDWTTEETPAFIQALPFFQQYDEELRTLLGQPMETRKDVLRLHAQAFARFPDYEQTLIRLGAGRDQGRLHERFAIILDETLPTRALTLFLDEGSFPLLESLSALDRRGHLEKYEHFMTQFPPGKERVGLRIASLFSRKRDMALEQRLLDRTALLLAETSPETLSMLWDVMGDSSTEQLLLESDTERLGTTTRILEKLLQAPSASIQRVRFELAREIAASEDPERVYEQVVEIFVRNNLPLVGKVFRVFEILHPPAQLDQKLEYEHLSPVLRALGHRERMMVFYKDLLRIHLASGNRELLTYFSVLQELDTVESCTSASDVEALPPEQKRQWTNVVRKVSTLLQNATFGHMHPETTSPLALDATVETLFQRYEAIKQDLSLAPGQRVKERLEEMFLRPIGLSSIEEATTWGRKKKQRTDERNRALVAAATEGRLTVQPGDMLKGFDDRYFANILQNGSVAKEFLGSSSDSDATPLDTDLSLVTPKDATKGLTETIKASLAKDYGSVLFCVRPKEQFRETQATDTPEELRAYARARTPDQVDYFKTQRLDRDRHMGIRTGFPLTEVDFLIFREGSTDPKKLRNMSMDLVVNGYYLPIVDATGKILFTPQEFDRYRDQFCRGLLSLGQPAFEVHSSDVLRDTLQGIHHEIEENEQALQEGQGHVTEIVQAVLKEFGALSAGQELLLEDTGSSGRGTGVPGSIDFDFVLKLDPVAMKHQVQIQETISKRLGGVSNGGDTRGQLRLKDIPLGNQKIEVDIAFVPQAEVRLFESHDAVRERLLSIKKTGGEEAFAHVQATIVYAKRVLKKAGAYKKAEQGGLGGIGVENWILAHHGNFIEAAESFVRTAKPDGEILLPLSAFQERYVLFDPGVNAKFEGTHDNFTRNLTEAGYKTMVKALEDELARLEPPVPIT